MNISMCFWHVLTRDHINWHVIMFFLSWYRKEKNNYSFTRNSYSLLILAGLSLGAHFWFWTESLKHTSIIISVVLVTLHPIFVGFGAYFFLKEPFSRSLVFGAAIALLGTLIMTGMDISLQNSLWGNFLALIGGIFFNFGNKEWEKNLLGVITYIFWICFFI